MRNPIGIVILAIGGLIAAGVLLWRHWDKVKAALGALWGKFKDVFAKIKQFVSKILGQVVGFFKENWRKIILVLFPSIGLALLVQKHWGKIVEKVKEIFGMVLGAVTDFASDLWNAAVRMGGDLLKGIINGAEAMLGWAKQKAKEIADSVVGFFKDPLGIFSPSKVMERQVGKPIAQGIIRGVVLGLRDLPREIDKPVQRAIDSAIKRIERNRGKFERAWTRMVGATSQVLSGVLQAQMTPAELALERLQSRPTREFQDDSLTAAEQELKDIRRATDARERTRQDRGGTREGR